VHLLHCSQHHSKRAVLCVVTPYMIQRSLCVMNGCYCVTGMDTRPLWPSRTTWASWTNIQGLLCWSRALRSSCSTSLLSEDVGQLRWGTSNSTTKVWLSVALYLSHYCTIRALFSVGRGSILDMYLSYKQLGDLLPSLVFNLNRLHSSSLTLSVSLSARLKVQ
jgi:hypothetical protein